MKVLITGAGGQLGIDLARLAAEEPHRHVVAAGHDQLDVGDRDAVLSARRGVDRRGRLRSRPG